MCGVHICFSIFPSPIGSNNSTYLPWWLVNRGGWGAEHGCITTYNIDECHLLRKVLSTLYSIHAVHNRNIPNSPNHL